MTAWAPVLTGLAFVEAPRWHDGALYVSDIFGGAVWRVDGDGSGARVVAHVPGRPSGLGWRADGSLLVVSMRDRHVLLVDDSGATSVLADLAPLVGGDCNDMLVAGDHAYVGNFGYDYVGGEERRPTVLVLVDTRTGDARAVADDLWFPNGMAMTPDGRTLLVAETPMCRITAFTVEDDGSLSDRRVFASFDAVRPDGIALDAEGGLWVASPGTAELVRVVEGGTVTDRLDPPEPNRTAQACALGGDDGRRLFVCSTPTHDEAEALARRAGRVDAVTV